MKNRILIISLVLFSILTAQNVRVVDKSQVNLRLKYVEAIKLENQNQVGKALDIFRYLTDQMPDEPLFYVKYFDLLFKTQSFDELDKILPDFITKYPANEKAKIDLGKLYFIQGDTIKAENTWNTYIEEANYSKLYSEHLFYALIELRQRDHAEEILLISREINNNNNLFAKELADFYYSSGRYKKSVTEYVKYLFEDERNISYVSDMLMLFPKEEKVFHTTDSVLVSQINKEDNLYLHQLRSDYLFSNRKYEDAAIEILTIEKMTDYPGESVLEFSNELVNIKAYQFAKKFFDQILKNKNFETITTEVLLKLAKVEEQLLTKDIAKSPLNYFLPGNFFFKSDFVYIDDDKNENLSNAFAIYDSLSSIDSDKPVGAQALFNIGKLRFTVLRDFDAAIESFELAEKKTKKKSFKYQCFNNRFLALISKGDLKKAFKELERVKNVFGRNYNKNYYRNRILLDMLNLKFDEITKVQDYIIKNLGFEDNAYNDYFELLTLIENNSDGEGHEGLKGLQRFISSELLIRQGKLTEAAEILKYIIENTPNAKINDESLLRLSQIYLQIGYFDESEKYAVMLMKTNSNYREITAKMFGEYYFTNAEMEKSKEWYQTILLDFPQSFFIEDARARLREIRGDKI